MPLISIIIPTRNRANLLPYAIQSALAQTYPNFEVIISDNSSTDNTNEVIRNISNDKLRYYRTDRVMHMPDSWEFALSHAKGDYVTCLCDDDAIHPNLLSRALQAAKDMNSDVVAWPFGGIYYHDNYDDFSKRNLFEFSYPTRRVSKISRGFILKELSESRFTPYLPRLSSSLYSKDAILEVRRHLGRLFFPIAPDYTSGLAILSVRKYIAFIDDLLLIWGIGKDTIGADQSTKRTSTSENFLEEFQNERDSLYAFTPLKVKTVNNIVANSVLRMKQVLGMSEFPFNWIAYFHRIHQDLLILQSHGCEVKEDLEEFFRVLATQPEGIQKAVGKRIKSQSSSKRLRRVAHMLLGNEKIKKVIKKNLLNRPSYLIFSGKDSGFSNIFECSQRIDQILLTGSEQ